MNVHLLSINDKDLVIKTKELIERYHNDDFVSFIDTRKTYLLLDDDNVLGYASFNVIKPEVDVLYVFIEEVERSKGYGFYLLNTIFKSLKDDGINRIFLEVDVRNSNAIKLYEKLGFKEISRRTNYYDNISDAICMEVVL